MRRISAIEALEIFMVLHKARGYLIQLNYGMLPPKKGKPGEDGNPDILPSSGSEELLTGEDIIQPNHNLSKTFLTIESFHGRD